MSKNTIFVQGKMLTWARLRAGLGADALLGQFPKLAAWEENTEQPTLRQLEEFARKVHVPFGYLLLPQPVQEQLPIPDLRTIADAEVAQPSPELLDTIYQCQHRQEWFREYALTHKLPELPFVGSTSVRRAVAQAAQEINNTLGFTTDKRKKLPNWTEALRHMKSQVEEAGILIMTNSVVGNNTHRKLRVKEFRGFVLADKLAPLIFINGADSKAAQMFTIAHELAHLWLGTSGVTDAETVGSPHQEIENWCNRVAAEMLLPLSELKKSYQPDLNHQAQIQHLAKQFKISSLVALRRLYDGGYITQELQWQLYQQELKRIAELDARQSGGGGDFQNTLNARVGKRFATALLSSAFEGQTLFRDASQLLGIKSNKTLYNAAKDLQVI